MIEPHEFTKGFGALTASRLNAMMEAAVRMPRVLEELEELRSLIRKPEDQEAVASGTLVAILGFRIRSGGDNFEYAWAEAAISATGGLSIVTDGANSYTTFTLGQPSTGSPFTTPAFNLAECGNNGLAWESGGVNRESSSWPAGFYVQPYRGDDGTTGPYNPRSPAGGTFWLVNRAPGTILYDYNGVKYFNPVAGLAEGECE